MKQFKEYLEVAKNVKTKLVIERDIEIHIPDYSADGKDFSSIEGFLKYFNRETPAKNCEIIRKTIELKNENGNVEFLMKGKREDLQKWINKFYKTGDKETDSVDFYIN